MITKMSFNEYLSFFCISVTNTILITTLEDKFLHNYGIPSVEYRSKIVKSKIYLFFFTFHTFLWFLFYEVLNSLKIYSNKAKHKKLYQMMRSYFLI